jgi:hypothetical protein
MVMAGSEKIKPFVGQLESFESCVVQVTGRGIKEESAKKLSVYPWASNYNPRNGEGNSRLRHR